MTGPAPIVRRLGDVFQALSAAAIIGLASIIWSLKTDVVELRSTQKTDVKFIERVFDHLMSQNKELRKTAEHQAAQEVSRDMVRSVLDDLSRRIEHLEQRPLIGNTTREPR